MSARQTQNLSLTTEHMPTNGLRSTSIGLHALPSDEGTLTEDVTQNGSLETRFETENNCSDYSLRQRLRSVDADAALIADNNARVSFLSLTSDGSSGRLRKNDTPRDHGPRKENVETIQGHGIPTLSANAFPAPDPEKAEPAHPAGAEFDDPNLDERELVNGIDDSPYPEVRAAVSNWDDPDLPVGTVRAWLIGVLFSIIIPGLNQFFYFRSPSVSITPVIVQLVSYPIGRLLARCIPRWKVLGISLNPGPFSIKEHTLVYIMVTIGSSAAYATNVYAVKYAYYNISTSAAYQWLLVMSTQMMGFAFGGLSKRFLVVPASMIWPATLVVSTLFNTLHSRSTGTEGGISRARFFVYVFCTATVWYVMPGYLFKALSFFSWVCWIAPSDKVVNQLFGVDKGLGMSMLSFDWAQIIRPGSPLSTPWWSQANIAGGFILFLWIITPALYYTNTMNFGYLPIYSRRSYDNTGCFYNQSRVLNADATLNVTAYHEYSPLYLNATFAVAYGMAFAAITATVMHTILNYRHHIYAWARAQTHPQPDVHERLMEFYWDVPKWWYLGLLVVTAVLGLAAMLGWEDQLPVWGFLLAVVIPVIFVIPSGMILASTNESMDLGVLSELIAGYIFPGEPISNMLFKTYGTVTLAGALAFTSGLKLGHYMKIPPRTLFFAQVIGTVVAGTTQVVVMRVMFENIQDMCGWRQDKGFTCNNTETFGHASIIWGLVGPARLFGLGGMYHAFIYFFLLGLAMPLLVWLISLKWPNHIFRYVHFPVVFQSTAGLPPAFPFQFPPFIIVGFIFQYIIRRHRTAWWTKYNYILNAALDSGLALGIIIVFFCLQFPNPQGAAVQAIKNWWGNTVYKKTDDYFDNGWLDHDGKFGPSTWK